MTLCMFQSLKKNYVGNQHNSLFIRTIHITSIFINNTYYLYHLPNNFLFRFIALNKVEYRFSLKIKLFGKTDIWENNFLYNKLCFEGKWNIKKSLVLRANISSMYFVQRHLKIRIFLLMKNLHTTPHYQRTYGI